MAEFRIYFNTKMLDDALLKSYVTPEIVRESSEYIESLALSYGVNPKYIKEYPLDVPIKIGDKAEDNSQLRPFITFFEEYVFGMDVAKDYVKYADIFIIIGTSLTVHPAANLIHYAHPEIPKFILNPNQIEVPDNFTYIQNTATKGIDSLIEKLISL